VKRTVQPTDIVDAYVKWAESSLDAWVAGTSRMRDAGRGSTPGYDWVAAGSTWMAEMTRAALDVYDGLCGGLGSSPAPVTATFAVSPRGSGLTGDAVLSLVGPLAAQIGSDTISAGLVTIDPPKLPADKVDFRLDVRPGAVSGGAYWGKVEAVLDGHLIDTVDVVVQVP
jgi:hypothetical protein